MSAETKPVCVHCGASVWWSMPRPEDPCYDCGKPINQGFRIIVTDHAMWRAAERFPRFDTVRIEPEVRAAMKEGRVHAERAHLGLRPTADPRSLYAWTPDGQRIYALRHDDEAFTVTTTMRRKDTP